MERENFIKQQSELLGFASCGITTTAPLNDSAVHLARWLAHGYNADMDYMARNVDKRIHPSLLVEGANSIIVLTHNYYPEKELSKNAGYTIAKFAYGEDYHHVLKDKMQQLVKSIEDYIKTDFQTTTAQPSIYRAFVDSAPVLERALAVRAGLGWIGRNSHLIQKGRGSYFFISTIFTSLELIPDQPFTSSYCGNCKACINQCPTQAILPNQTIDSNKCISYQTIESKTANNNSQLCGTAGELPSIFGCDICQQVCPHNRFAIPHDEPRLKSSEALQNFCENSKWNSITEEEFKIISKKSPLKRAKYSGIIRNSRY